MNKNKRNLIIILGSILVAIIGVVIYLFFFASEKKKYISEPISQTSLSTMSENISLKQSFDASELPIYAISEEMQLDNIKKMIETLGLVVKESSQSDAGHYKWSGDDWDFFYNVNTNTLRFEISEGINVGLAELNEHAFANFVKKYFNQDWEYEVTENVQGKTAKFTYVQRTLTGTCVESKNYGNYTDYLSLKDGKITSGEVFLTQFENTGLYAPLIDSSRLNTLINVKGYPKEIYVDYSVLQTTVLQEVDYLGDEFEELTETVSDCVSNEIEIVYLYKSFEETYLTPVYKIDSQCTVEYENTKYSVPATAYVNAIDPEYISMPE